MPIKFPDGNGGVTLVGADFSSVRANFDRTTLEGNPIFEGTPTFTESIKAASIVADFTDSTLLGVEVSASMPIGTGLSMSGDTLNVAVASADSLGGVKIGTGLSMSDDTLNRSDYFEDEVSLHGGVRVWDNLHLSNGASISGVTNYFKFTNSTIDTESKLHYYGDHYFRDHVTLKSGFFTADSMKSDFGDYGSIKATHDTINVSYSTITGNATVTGMRDFTSKVTLQGEVTFNDDIKVADSLDVDLGSSSKILAKKNTIDLTGSEITGNHSVNGNTYFEEKQHFLKPIVAHDGVSLIGELKSADSLSHDFGSRTQIIATRDTLDFRDSYLRLEGATLSGVTLGSSVILDTVPSTVEGAMWYVL